MISILKRPDLSRKTATIVYPYYGDFICDLKQYKASIDKLEKIYLSDDYFLIPSHGNIYLEKDEHFFKRIRNKIKMNEIKVLNALSRNQPKSIKELENERIITPKERIYAPIRKLYYVWDGGMIYQHLKELINQEKVEKIETNDFLNDKYILV